MVKRKAAVRGQANKGREAVRERAKLRVRRNQSRNSSIEGMKAVREACRVRGRQAVKEAVIEQTPLM
jgi:hypothetical protein